MQSKRRDIWLKIGLMVSLLALAVACEPPLPTAQEQSLPTPTSTQDRSPLTPTPPSVTRPPTPPAQNSSETNPEMAPLIQAAQADLAERLNISLEGIVIQSAEAVEWPDASLGCPQPGMMYAQVITPGYRIVLTAQGQDYVYHSDQKRVIACPQADQTSLDAPAGPQAEFPLADFDPALFLFVELVEIRVSEPEGGQTTSFEGDMTTYRFDAANGTLAGELNQAVDQALRMVVGKLTQVQIGQNRAVGGQLYAYPGESLPNLIIRFTGVDATGQVCFTYQDAPHCLAPGESITLQAEQKPADDEALPIFQKTSLTVTNHGFLNKTNLVPAP